MANVTVGMTLNDL